MIKLPPSLTRKVALLNFTGVHRYRLTAVDRENEWKGKVREMWTVDQTKFHKGTAFFAFTKIGAYAICLPTLITP